jgi:hypothetical protein
MPPEEKVRILRVRDAIMEVSRCHLVWGIFFPPLPPYPPPPPPSSKLAKSGTGRNSHSQIELLFSLLCQASLPRDFPNLTMGMALNLIEAVAAPKSNSDSKKRKRSEDSGSGSGSSSQYGSGSRQPRFDRTNESPRSHSMGSGSSYGPGSGYGPGYGSTHTGNRFQNQSYFPMRPRGSAVSVSSRGTMGSFSSSADRGGNNGGYRGGGGGGSGGRGPFRGRPWPRW